LIVFRHDTALAGGSQCLLVIAEHPPISCGPACAALVGTSLWGIMRRPAALPASTPALRDPRALIHVNETR
jgi:hypothetical protein